MGCSPAWVSWQNDPWGPWPQMDVRPPPLHHHHHAALGDTQKNLSPPPPPRQDVVNCVGGMGVLLPLLEQVVSKKEEAEDEEETNDLVGPELTSSRNAQGMLIPLGRSSGEVPEWGEGGEVP